MKTDGLMARFLAVFLASLFLLGGLFTVVGSVNPSSMNVGSITDRKTPTIPNTSTDSPATNTQESNSTAKYWLKLDALQAYSSKKIYMGFALIVEQYLIKTLIVHGPTRNHIRKTTEQVSRHS